jgi:subfamily B ATP-binding cassette protein MsbA
MNSKLQNDDAYYIIHRLLRDHVKPYTKQIVLALCLMAICAASSAILVKLVQPAIDDIFLTHNKQMLILIPLVTLLLSSVKGVAEYFQNYLIKFVGQRILTDLQILMYDHLLKSDLSWIQNQSSGRLISRFTNDISMMRGAVSNLLVGCAKHFLTVLFLICLMFQLEPILSVFVFLVFPIAIYPVQKLGRRMRKVVHNTQEELGEYIAKLDETFHSIKVVKSYMAEDTEITRARAMVEKILDLYKKSAKFDALTSPIMEILSGLAISGIILYGGIMIINGTTTTGSLFAFITAFVSAYRPYKSLVSLNVNLQEGLASSRRLFQILDMKPTIKDHIGAIDIHFTKPNIVFQDVSLNFGNKVALERINVTIESGKTTAIVGQSGGGKTTIANLLVRFYEPSTGKISIDGHDISEITLSALRGQIALITQDTLLFDASVAENIAYGKPSASNKDIIAAAKNAAAHEFIMQLPNGYQTIIGAHGMTLSGGQRQRISIARAFLKDAPILIMDEATSALDLQSEWFVQKALKQLRLNRTTIIVTHRLSSIIDSDTILVLKNGVIVEAGNHETLMQNKREYYQLFLNDSTS